MIAILALALVPSLRQGAAYYDVPVSELELGSGVVLPQYSYEAPWLGDPGAPGFPWVAVDGSDSAIFVQADLDEPDWSEREAYSDIIAIGSAIDGYAIENAGRYPESIEVLITPDANGHTFLDQETVPTDPWGNPYLFEPPTSGTDKFRVVSYGRDGQPGGEGVDADIDNIEFRNLTRNNGNGSELGKLLVSTDARRDLSGTLFLPKASGGGFLRIPFRIPASRATSSETAFRRAELAHYRRLLQSGVPGGAWFRHRVDELRAAVDPAFVGGVETVNRPQEFRGDDEALELFSGGRALYENLQLERGLPASPVAEAKVALASIPGLTVRAIDWKPLLASGETRLDALAALIPADQHGLFFPSFQAFTDVLDEANRLGTFGLGLFEGRSADALTRERTERQLCLEVSALARTFGPMLVESVALTGSDPYLRSGSDLALLFRAKTAEAVRAYVALRQDAAVAGEVRAVQGDLAGVAYRGVVDPARSVSSYLAVAGDVVVVSNSLPQLERVLKTAAKQTPALASADEFRFFRQRYALGSAGESCFLVLPDAAIRRWCSPRWRIGNARVVRAAGELADLHARHLRELVAGPSASKDLGPDADFPDLGALRLTPAGVLSPTYGTLDFLTPIAELPLDRVTEREANLYKTWLEGYERAWSNFFDPIGARLAVGEQGEGKGKGTVALDLTVRPLILDTQYDDLRAATQGTGLEPGSGDPHPTALIQLVLSINPKWETLKSAGMSLGPAAQALGADPFAWLGNWMTVYLDDGPVWDDLLQAEDPTEAWSTLESQAREVPLTIAVAVADPLKLALFLTSLRAFVDGTAPGMTEWKDRTEGERRFVEIGSPGMGDEFKLFYATTPRAFFLSLNEKALLGAMERQERRGQGGKPEASPWDGANAALELHGRGLELAELLLDNEVAKGLQGDSWHNLPILNEWRRLFPERDPVELHRQVFHEELECPGGGKYRWNADWHTMESSVFGHPGLPVEGLRRPPAWDDLARVGFALTFEQDGLRVRAELERE